MTRKHLRTSAEIEARAEKRTVHQFNDNAVRLSRNLAEGTGMERIGLHLVRIEPGRDSTTHHFHDADEEFLYILSGRGIARIGEDSFEVGPGDFMGFPAPSPPHSMHNPNDEDLVYLMGGERNSPDVVHYPELERSMMKTGGRRLWAQWDDIHEVEGREEKP